jgi:tetratricopeptide (TPR) repeat protein
MDKNRVLKILQKIYNLLVKRVGFLYFAIFIFFTFFIGNNFKMSSDIQALNRIMPSFEPLVAYNEQGKLINEEVLDQQVLYFKSVLRYMTGFSAAHELIGITYYLQGEGSLAERSFKDAVKTNPDMFWFLYNQGIFYYKKKNFSLATESFEKALACDPKKTLQFMFVSKIYLPLFISSKLDLGNTLAQRLQEGYASAYQFIIDGYLQQDDYANAIRYAKLGVQTNLDQRGIYHYYVGMSSYYLKDFKTAIFYLQESVKKNPSYANSFYYLGMSIQAVGKEELANTFLEQAKKLKTSQDPLQKELDQKHFQIY